MVIKGPRSALSKFLKENNIKVSNYGKNTQQKDDVNNDMKHFIHTRKQKIYKKNKRIKPDLPFEIINFECKMTLKLLVLEKIHNNFCSYKLNDEQVHEYSMYLHKKRLLTQRIFDHLVECADKKLIVYDCSMISTFNICKDLHHLELHYCGQLTEEQLNSILRHNKNLKVLKITGAFLLKNIDLFGTDQHNRLHVQKHLRVIDFSNCSRLNNSCFNQINQLNELDLLNISYCYGFTSECRLKINVKRIIADETKISDKFFMMKDINYLDELSIANCPLLFVDKGTFAEFIGFFKLTKLNIEGISPIQHVRLNTLNELKAKNCFNLAMPLENSDLKVLDISRIDYSRDDLKLIMHFKNLEYLNVSFNSNVDDLLIAEYVSKIKNIKTIVLFGCFKLTKKCGELAWSIKNSIKIVGNHAETMYLMDN